MKVISVAALFWCVLLSGFSNSDGRPMGNSEDHKRVIAEAMFPRSTDNWNQAGTAWNAIRGINGEKSVNGREALDGKDIDGEQKSVNRRATLNGGDLLKPNDFETLQAKVEEVHKKWEFIMQDYVKYTKNNEKQLPDVHTEIQKIGSQLKNFSPELQKMKYNPKLCDANKILTMMNDVDKIKKELKTMEVQFQKLMPGKSGTLRLYKQLLQNVHQLQTSQLLVSRIFHNIFVVDDHMRAIDRKLTGIDTRIQTYILPKVKELQKKNQDEMQNDLKQNEVEKITLIDDEVEQLMKQLSKIKVDLEDKHKDTFEIHKTIKNYQHMGADGNMDNNIRMSKRNPNKDRNSDKFDHDRKVNKPRIAAIITYITTGAMLFGIGVVVIVMMLTKDEEVRYDEEKMERPWELPFPIDKSTSQYIIPIGSRV